MAKAFVFSLSPAAQQPEDGTIQLECNAMVAGEDVALGSYQFGTSIIVNPETTTPNALEQAIRTAVRDFARVHTPTPDGPPGVTIPSGSLVLPDFIKL